MASQQKHKLFQMISCNFLRNATFIPLIRLQKYHYGGKPQENKKMLQQKLFWLHFVLNWVSFKDRDDIHFFSLFSFLSYWRQKIYSLYLLYGGKSQEELWLKNLIGCWLGQEPPSKKWGDILTDFITWVGGFGGERREKNCWKNFLLPHRLHN